MLPMMVKINVHSIVDLITNSSTSIFTFYDKSVDIAKEMINEFLLVLGHEGKTWKDFFVIGVFLDADIYQYTASDISDVDVSYEQINDLIHNILHGRIEKPEWMKEIEKSYADEYGRGNEIYIESLEPEYDKLASDISKLIVSPESRECCT